ncbi:MAG TPA: hypothetical protein VK836_09550 [Streptosporangiaceae bacterium]|nr:hypothetical protein [Streptosporangiaceae bacterium]
MGTPALCIRHNAGGRPSCSLILGTPAAFAVVMNKSLMRSGFSASPSSSH